jgi:6-phosphogluconolactonase
MTTADPAPTSAADPELLVLAGPDDVAEALAARLTARLLDIQRSGRVPQVALTGGRIATKAYQRLAADGAQSSVDWGRVDLWWGDERFVAADDDDRNDLATVQVLQDSLALDPARIHRMPARDGSRDLDAAAAAYADELGGTTFDLCLLGLGPDGHVASLFPDHPSSSTPGRVIAVRDSPKPPPDRISLTLEVINASAEVWFLVSGEDKAEAARLALTHEGPVPVPGARAVGVERTVWFLDEAAASSLPEDIRGPVHP